MRKIYTCHLNDIKTADFPLNHDCVLKVRFHSSCGIKHQYFTCEMKDSGNMVSIINQICVVKSIEVLHIDNFCE